MTANNCCVGCPVAVKMCLTALTDTVPVSGAAAAAQAGALCSRVRAGCRPHISSAAASRHMLNAAQHAARCTLYNPSELAPHQEGARLCARAKGRLTLETGLPRRGHAGGELVEAPTCAPRRGRPQRPSHKQRAVGQGGHTARFRHAAWSALAIRGVGQNRACLAAFVCLPESGPARAAA